ncbi:MAG: NUDIX hydrolase [Myxococcota bacterium]
MQRVYWLLYRGARIYWAVARPHTFGALVALWRGDRILLVQSSYAPYLSLPGGYLKRGEDGRTAAVRELREELGIDVAMDDLLLSMDLTHGWEGKRERVQIFSMELERDPLIQIDHREIVRAAFYSPEEVEVVPVFAPIRDLVARRCRLRSSAGLTSGSAADHVLGSGTIEGPIFGQTEGGSNESGASGARKVRDADT